MVELNHRDRTIKVKLVYYGPPVGGKTTNLQILHRCADAKRRGELISINSAQDRTILFDLLPLKTPGFRGFDLRLQVLAVPGQAMYSATRRLVLKGADSLVFVANSALDRWEENIQSYREMTQNLISHHLDPEAMPLVLQYNKRDLPQKLDVEALDRALNRRGAEVVPAIAVQGEGVLETFGAILARTVQDLASRYAILDVKQGAPARQWAEQALLELFGRTRLTGDPQASPATRPMPKAEPPPGPGQPVAPPPSAPPSGPPSGHTVVRVAPPPAPAEEAHRPAGPEAKASELVETYAEASAQLGVALTELREERDVARQRLDDLRQTMLAAQELLSGTPLEAALEPVLARMARIAGASHAAFWVPQPGQPPRAAALLGLPKDPVLPSPAALRHVSETAARGAKPAFAFGAENLDLGQALDQPGSHFAALLAVPFRTPGGLQGLAVFYYGPDTARPGPEALEHLAEIPRAVAVALELVATLNTVKAAERALELALAGTASLRGLEHLVGSHRDAARPPGGDPQPARRAVLVHRAVRQARPGSRLGPRRRPVAPGVQPRRDPAGRRLPRGPARRAADAGGDRGPRPGGRDRAGRRGAPAGGAARDRRRGALEGRRQHGPPLDPRRGVVRRRPGERALARRGIRGAPGRGRGDRGPRAGPRPAHRRDARRHARGRRRRGRGGAHPARGLREATSPSCPRRPA